MACPARWHPPVTHGVARAAVMRHAVLQHTAWLATLVRPLCCPHECTRSHAHAGTGAPLIHRREQEMGEYEFVFGVHFIFHKWEVDVEDGEMYVAETVSCETVQHVLEAELRFEELAEELRGWTPEELPF